MGRISRRLTLAAVVAAGLGLGNGPALAGAEATEPPALERLASALIETDAVGALDKLAIHSRVDALAQAFYYFHDGRSALTLADLRTRFDQLHDDIVTMLSEDDAALAREVEAARDDLWHAFSDPDEFASGIGSDIADADDQLANRLGL